MALAACLVADGPVLVVCPAAVRPMCCHTCAQIDAEPHGTAATRVFGLGRLVMINNFRRDAFTFLSPETYRYFVHWQPYFDDDSIVKVGPTGVKNFYSGAEGALEYYTLQNRWFNPSSYRNFGILAWNLTQHQYASWQTLDEDGRRIMRWSLYPQLDNGEPTPIKYEQAYDFAMFVWNDDVSLAPWGSTWHNFRWPRLPPEAFSGSDNIPLFSTYGEVDELCHQIQEQCTGLHQQFADFRECYDYLSQVPDHKLGYCPIFAGNTRACRWTHLLLTHEKLRPEIHCWHVGRHDAPDPSGLFKCSDSKCGYERQGPVTCGKEDCTFEYTHAGEVVELIHIACWAAMLFACGVFVLTTGCPTFEKRRAGNDLVRLQLVVCVVAAVCAIYFIIFVTAYAAQPTLIWRPPPPAALERRWSEKTRGEIISFHYQSGDYGAKNTETLVSHWNK